MNYQRLLGLYHYCMNYHTGQSSREYKLLCKVQRSVAFSGSHQLLDCLLDVENQEAGRLYERLGGEWTDVAADLLGGDQ